MSKTPGLLPRKILESATGVPEFCSFQRQHQEWTSAWAFLMVWQSWAVLCGESVHPRPRLCLFHLDEYSVSSHWRTGTDHTRNGMFKLMLYDFQPIIVRYNLKRKKKKIVARPLHSKYNLTSRASWKWSCKVGLPQCLRARDVKRNYVPIPRMPGKCGQFWKAVSGYPPFQWTIGKCLCMAGNGPKLMEVSLFLTEISENCAVARIPCQTSNSIPHHKFYKLSQIARTSRA